MTLTAEGTASAGELRNVDMWYGDHHVLVDVSVRIGEGEIVALIGRSGSGKSTVLRVLSGLSTDHTGERVIPGRRRWLSRSRGFPVARRAHQCAYGLTRSRFSKAEAAARADRALHDVASTDRADVWPLTLSGGQAQRVSLARALVAEPQLLLLDEPFGALDALTRLSMRALLLDLWREHAFGVLLVTHDVDEAVALADRVLVLEDGRVIHKLAIADPRTVDARRPSPDRTARPARCAHRRLTIEKGLPCAASSPCSRSWACWSTGCVSREESSAARRHRPAPRSELTDVTLKSGIRRAAPRRS